METSMNEEPKPAEVSKEEILKRKRQQGIERILRHQEKINNLMIMMQNLRSVIMKSFNDYIIPEIAIKNLALSYFKYQHEIDNLNEMVEKIEKEIDSDDLPF